MLDFRPLLKEMSEIHAGSKYYGSIRNLLLKCGDLGHSVAQPGAEARHRGWPVFGDGLSCQPRTRVGSDAVFDSSQRPRYLLRYGHCDAVRTHLAGFPRAQDAVNAVTLDHTYGPEQRGGDHLSAHQVIEHEAMG